MSVYNRFGPKDDARLKELVEKYGENNWKIIASKMYGRAYRQVKDRWLRYLSPEVNRNPWTQEEEDLLIRLVPTMSPHWKEIASHFSGRTDIQVKTHYKVLKNRAKKQITEIEQIPTEEFSFDEFEFDVDNFEFVGELF